MSRFWDRILGLNRELFIWVEEEELGKEKVIDHKNERYCVKIPQEIDRKTTLRLKGLGKARLHKTGDLLVHVWLNRGEDVRKYLWLPETSARIGAHKKMFSGEKTITIVIPPKSHNGLTIRLKGLGREPVFSQQAPVLDQKKRGNLLVKLMVYPDSVTPQYKSVGILSAENMALEEWAYGKIDELIAKVSKTFFYVKPLTAEAIADLMNEWGWRGIFQALVNHLKLAELNIAITQSVSILQPGNCERMAIMRPNNTIENVYKITINEQFLDNPFSIVAILAHELCHIVHYEIIEKLLRAARYRYESENATLEEERTVDLLVFMLGMGEFQLRVARDKRLTLGYFNQEVFENIQGIVSRRLNSP